MEDKNLAKTQIFVGGMSCAACSQRLEKTLNSLPGVSMARVNLATETASLEYDEQKIGKKAIEAAIIEVGFKVIAKEEKASRADEAELAAASYKKLMSWSWIFTAPIMLWMIIAMVAGISWPGEKIVQTFYILLSFPAVFIFGKSTQIAGWRGLFKGGPNMSTLISISTLAAFITGPASFFVPIANYASVGAMIMAIHLTGKYIEARAKGKASQAIKRLLEIGAPSARILRGEKELEVPIEEIVVGDIMIIRPGEKIPTDGEIILGQTSVNEAIATGESIPVMRTLGDEVIGATINQDGLIQVKATRVGQETFLAQVVKLVQEAQGTKVPIQAFADRVTGFFVPVVLVLSVITFLMWLFFAPSLRGLLEQVAGILPWLTPEAETITLAFSAAIALLVIACPCSLGLATPTALMVGSGLGAEKGILIRRGEAIQTLQHLEQIIFDKTGTLTEGKPQVIDVLASPGVEKELVLKAALTAEQGSEHPLGKAIVAYVQKQGYEAGKIEEFTNYPGQGVEIISQGQKIIVGSPRWFTARGYVWQGQEGLAEKLESQGKTLVFVAQNDVFLGIISLADKIKDGAKEALAALHKLGIKTGLLTGDNERTAQAVAQELGIKEVYAQVMPKGKVDKIKELQANFGRVGMVGDGINDAPALAQADVGIALGSGTDIAIETADITLVRGDLQAVVEAIILSQATFRKIKQNLFWAFFYNLVAIPIAMFGFLHPVISELAMAASSITVVTNANLLRRQKLEMRSE